jgi:hypothetical protein
MVGKLARVKDELDLCSRFGLVATGRGLQRYLDSINICLFAEATFWDSSRDDLVSCSRVLRNNAA